MKKKAPCNYRGLLKFGGSGDSQIKKTIN